MQKRKHLILVYISIGAGVIIAPLLILFIFAPLIFFQSSIDSILKAESSEVTMVKIGPMKTLKSNWNLIDKEIIIKDPEFIKKLCAELNKAHLDSRRGGTPKWRALVELVTNDKEHQFLLSIDRIGTQIKIMTKGEWGLDLGNYRSNRAGVLFENYLVDKGIIANK